MDLHIWKQSKYDNYVMINVPYYKVKEIMEAFGGKVVAEYWNAKLQVRGWTIRFDNEEVLAKSIEDLKILKAKGVNLEEEEPNGQSNTRSSFEGDDSGGEGGD